MDIQRLPSGLAFAVEGEGPTVLLMHGFPDTLETWRETAAALVAAGFRAVSIAMRGIPPSAIPLDHDFTLARLARDATDVLDFLRVRDAVFIGHDWGASAAYAAAALTPRRVRRLVCLAIPPLGLLPSGLTERIARPHRLTLAQGRLSAWWLARNDFAMVERIYRRWSPRWPAPEAHLRTVKTAFGAPGVARAVVDYYSAHDDARALLGPVKSPTLLLYGNDEPAPRRAAFGAADGWLCRGSRVVRLEGVGHFPHLEAPREVIEEILAFLDAPPPCRAQQVEMAQ